MLEINPVLAGTFDAPDYTPATTNIGVAGNAADSAGADNAQQTTTVADARRYTQFDRSVTDAGSTTNFSFGDLLDTLNPLQHIPVISSVYRAIAGTTINPVARVAGDMLYGGALGGVSAIVGGVGAVANATLEEETGKDAGGSIIAALFGPNDAGASTQIASAATTTPPAATTTSPAPAKIAAAPETSAPAPVSPPSPSNVVLPAPTVSAATVADITAPSGTIPLALSKTSTLKPFGGVMAMPNVESQNMAMALSAAAPGMRLGRTIYTGKLMNGPHPLTLAPSFVPSSTSSTNSTAGNNGVGATLHVATASAGIPPAGTDGANTTAPYGLPSGLLDDIAALKAVNQYKNVAGGASPLGTGVNVTN
jgi:hypothetical protein